MRRYQVFISSTFEDLKLERQAVLSAVLEMEHLPAGMELFPAADASAWKLICGVIDASDYHLVIIGGRYGSQNAEGIGFTEREYEYARASRKPIIPLLHANPANLPRAKTDTDETAWHRLIAFRQKIEENHTCAYWENPEELRTKTLLGLKSAIEQSPGRGWMRSTESRPTRSFVNLFEATPHIVRSLKAALAKRRGKPLLIYILGGRIRAMTPMLDQVLQDIARSVLRPRDVTFAVCCFDHERLSDWRIPSVSDDAEFRRRMENQAAELRLNLEELLEYNRHPSFLANRIRIEPRPYSGFPVAYAVVIGEHEVYWGHYRWNIEIEDFEGPANPCFYADSKASDFHPYRDWILNRIALNQMTSSASGVLFHAFEVNRQAYDMVASEYVSRRSGRTSRLEDWFAPVQAELAARFGDAPRVLDVGSGDGSIAKHFFEIGCDVTALDFSPAMCRHFRRHVRGVSVLEGEFLETDFGDEKFNCVLAIAFVHLIPPPWNEEAIRKVAGLLLPRGIACFATSIHEREWQGFSRKLGFRRKPVRYRQHYTRESFEKIVVRSGLEIIEIYETPDPIVEGKVWASVIAGSGA